MAVLDLGTGATWFSGTIVARPAANFSLSLFSDHDCPAFHQPTVPKVKPGFPPQRQPRVSLNSLSLAPCPSTRENKNLVIGQFFPLSENFFTSPHTRAEVSLQ